MTTLDRAAVEEKVADYKDWTMGDDGQLHAEYVFRSFSEAMLFASAVGHLAESFDHHPDIFIHSYKHVKLSVMSHDVQGITERDFRLIAAIDALPQRT